jgi:hypothetical protein
MLRRLSTAGFWLLIVLVFLFPYSAPAHEWCDPFSFPATTLVLLALFTWRWRKGIPARLGIPRRTRQIIAAFATLAVLYVAIRWLVTAMIVGGQEIVLVPFDPVTRAGFLFQALNEEILLGFLPLMALWRRFGRPVAVAVALAAVFTLLHVALYRFGGEQTWIRWETTIALLAVGVLRNALILHAGHIGYAWALHAAWNLNMFSGQWRRGAEGPFLREPAVFDLFLGSPAVIGLAGAAALIALLPLALRRAARDA